MADLNTLYISKINNINIIQEGESVVSAENNEADYSEPKGNNKTKKLGAGQEAIEIAFRSISDENTTALKKVLRVDNTVTLTDKFKGSYKVTVSSYRITDSDRHIGVTKFSATFKIKEQLKTPVQNLSSKLTSASASLSNAIDMTMDVSTANLIDSAVEAVEDKVSLFDEASNFANSTLEKIGQYKKELKEVVDNASALIHQPIAFKNKILGVISGFVNIYATARQAYEAARNIAVLKRDITDSLSIFRQKEISNANVTVNASNMSKASIMLATMPLIEFDSMDDAKEAQAALVETLNEIYDNDELVESIKNDVSNYIQSLDLPNVVEIEVFQKPLFVLSYDLYATTERADQLRALNGFLEDDNVTGTIKVFDR